MWHAPKRQYSVLKQIFEYVLGVEKKDGGPFMVRPPQSAVRSGSYLVGGVDI